MDQGRDPLAGLQAAAAAREAAGLRRALRPRPPAPGSLIDLASNDYLGLCRHPLVVEGAAAAAREWGAGATGSRLVTGDTTLHAALERALADFAGASRALVFSSGYLANLAAVTALAAALQHGSPAAGPRPEREGALVVSDEANHASIVDACRLARARVEIVAHNDPAAVDRALARRREPAALVVTESVFSVSGDLAPLARLHRASRAHGALLLVDEAHALGVAGAGGRGAAWDARIAGEPDVVQTVTLSKALGAQGGAVLGHDDVIATLVDAGRSFIFDTGLAPPSAGAALSALRALAAQPDLPARARRAARRVAGVAGQLGLTATVPEAAVVTVVVGAAATAVEAQRICADHGIMVGCFRPPATPPGRSCLRLTTPAGLTDRDMDAVGRALAAVADHVAAGPRAARAHR